MSSSRAFLPSCYEHVQRPRYGWQPIAGRGVRSRGCKYMHMQISMPRAMDEETGRLLTNELDDIAEQMLRLADG